MRPCVLVVDDDVSVARWICDALETQGYRLTYCTDAVQAVIQAEGLKINLLITDIMMPTFGTGVDAYNSIRSHPFLDRNLPVLFLTGLKPEAAKAMIPNNDPNVRLLHKPLSAQLLIDTVRELLESHPSPKASQA